MSYLGYRAVNSTVRILFTTHDKEGGAVAPSTAFETADVRLYKDGSATERSSQAGWTMTSPFDSITGLHQLAIDLSDNTDAGFYAAGSHYKAVLAPNDETVDSKTPLRVIAEFDIGVAPANLTQWKGSAPNDLVSSRVDASVGAIANNAITAASIASDAIQAAKIQDGALTAAKFASGAFDAVWSVGSRSLTTFGSLVSDIVGSVWAAGSRTLTAFGFGVDANVTQWKGGTPGNLDSNGFVPGNLAAVNGNTGRAGELADWLDAELLPGIDTKVDALPAETAEATLTRDLALDEDTAPIHSLHGLALKGVSRIQFDDEADELLVYKTDGTTVKYVQATTQGSIDPLTGLGPGEDPE